jgi:IMP dehydrogenase
MAIEKIAFEGITYDDVLLVPGYSEILPRETNLVTKLTKDITLNIPLLSAAMDTITEANMAVAIAREGGIGVIHKNLSIENQAGHVDRVKRSESGMIKKTYHTHYGQKCVRRARADGQVPYIRNSDNR